MGKWNSKEVAKRAAKDFETAWLETGALLPRRGSESSYPRTKAPYGKPHLLFETVERLREAYLRMGFEEVANPIFIEDAQVGKQFGPEAAAVLDRCYYLGGLPRPDVGLSDEKVAGLQRLGIDPARKEDLQEVLHRYKKGEFGGDELPYEVARALGVSDALVSRLLDEVLPEFKALAPEATRLTLRSHMTSGWFLTLESLVGKKTLPIKLFSVDRCFRREQREDETHLRSHISASCVLLDEVVDTDDGKAVAEGLLEQFGFTRFRFQPDEKRSKYYAPGTQTEVYAEHPKIGWVEVATFGIYSPVALSRYKIEYPVMNLGLGVERLAMVLHGHGDIRAMVYPQFYAPWVLTDRELASMLRVARSPLTPEGRAIAERIVEAAVAHAHAKAPCEYPIYSGPLGGADVDVRLVEREEGKSLLGPAAFNELYVSGGSIYGLPPEEKEIRTCGLPCNIRYIDAIALLAASRLEAGVSEGKEKVVTRIPVVKGLSDINMRLEDVAMRYITTKGGVIDIRGPVFMRVEASITRRKVEIAGKR